MWAGQISKTARLAEPRCTRVRAASPHQALTIIPGDPSEGQQKGLAIAALILGILSFFTFGLFVVGAIVGIVLAAKAMGRVSREPWRYGGRGMAIAGLVLSITSLVSAVPLGIIAAIAIPNLIAAHRAANEGSAIAFAENNLVSGTDVSEQLREVRNTARVGREWLIDSNLGSGTKNGYTFTVTLDSENPEAFEVTGVPVTYRSSGTRSFYIDETFVIRGADNYGGPSTKMDEPLGSEVESSGRSRRRVEYRPATWLTSASKATELLLPFGGALFAGAIN